MIMNADIFTDATISRLLLASPYIYKNDEGSLQEQTSENNDKNLNQNKDYHYSLENDEEDLFSNRVFALAKWDVDSFHIDILENILSKLKHVYKNDIVSGRQGTLLSLEHFYLMHNIDYPFPDEIKRGFNQFVGIELEQNKSTIPQGQNHNNKSIPLYSSSPTLRVDSQDAWVFKPIYLDNFDRKTSPFPVRDKSKQFKSNITSSGSGSNSIFSNLDHLIEMTNEIEFGRARCDNRLAYLFKDITKAKVTSPSLGLSTHHLHKREPSPQAEASYIEGYSMKVGEKVPGKGSSVPLSTQYLF